ncbi:MAG TPA: ATP-binding cassette domain-containing protein, partial [Casimicrobiaceae bacterium]
MSGEGPSRAANSAPAGGSAAAKAASVGGPLLRIAGLEAGYGEMQVLRNVSLDVRPAEIVAMVGGNGAGKTTLLR